MPRKFTCPVCDGSGKSISGVRCYYCNGTGKAWDYRAEWLKYYGLTEKQIFEHAQRQQLMGTYRGVPDA